MVKQIYWNPNTISGASIDWGLNPMRHPKPKMGKYNRKDQRNRHKRELLIEPFLGRRITINATVDEKSVVTGDIFHTGEPTVCLKDVTPLVRDEHPWDHCWVLRMDFEDPADFDRLRKGERICFVAEPYRYFLEQHGRISNDKYSFRAIELLGKISDGPEIKGLLSSEEQRAAKAQERIDKMQAQIDKATAHADTW